MVRPQRERQVGPVAPLVLRLCRCTLQLLARSWPQPRPGAPHDVAALCGLASSRLAAYKSSFAGAALLGPRYWFFLRPVTSRRRRLSAPTAACRPGRRGLARPQMGRQSRLRGRPKRHRRQRLVTIATGAIAGRRHLLGVPRTEQFGIALRERRPVVEEHPVTSPVWGTCCRCGNESTRDRGALTVAVSDLRGVPERHHVAVGQQQPVSQRP